MWLLFPFSSSPIYSVYIAVGPQLPRAEHIIRSNLNGYPLLYLYPFFPNPHFHFFPIGTPSNVLICPQNKQYAVFIICTVVYLSLSFIRMILCFPILFVLFSITFTYSVSRFSTHCCPGHHRMHSLLFDYPIPLTFFQQPTTIMTAVYISKDYLGTRTQHT